MIRVTVSLSLKKDSKQKIYFDYKWFSTRLDGQMICDESPYDLLSFGYNSRATPDMLRKH